MLDGTFSCPLLPLAVSLPGPTRRPVSLPGPPRREGWGMSSYGTYCQDQAADCARRARLARSPDIAAYCRSLGLRWIRLAEQAQVADPSGRTRDATLGQARPGSLSPGHVSLKWNYLQNSTAASKLGRPHPRTRLLLSSEPSRRSWKRISRHAQGDQKISGKARHVLFHFGLQRRIVHTRRIRRRCSGG